MSSWWNSPASFRKLVIPCTLGSAVFAFAALFIQTRQVGLNILAIVAALAAAFASSRAETIRELPRAFTTEQRHAFLEMLEMNEPGSVDVISSTADQEAMAFSDAIAELLSQAGWATEKMVTPEAFPTGLTIVRHSDCDPVEPLAKAFRAAKWDVRVETGEDDSFMVVVGSKPLT